MGGLPRGGGMAAVEASEEEVEERLAGYEGRLEGAAVNGPSAVVVSGEEEALEEWLGGLGGGGGRRLRVGPAVPSPGEGAELGGVGGGAVGLRDRGARD